MKIRSHDKPADIVDRLVVAGFHADDPETVLVGLSREIASHDVSLSADVMIRQTTSDDDMDRIAETGSVVWGDQGWLAENLKGRLRIANPIAVFVAEAGGEIVASGWLSIAAGTEFAGLWGGTTLPEWRGQGIYRSLVVRRARHAGERGARYLQVDASDNSRPILERMGFVAIATTTPYVWSP